VRLDDLFGDEVTRSAIEERISGVVVAVVTNNKDPDKLARVKVRFPWLSDQDESQWARIAVPMAGSQRGVYFLPEVDDEVLVAFEHGDIRFPYVVGALWNGKDAPPVTNDDGKNNVRVLRSRSGHVIRLNDENGKETLEIVDKSGNNSLMFDTARNTVTIASAKDITLKAPNGTITLDARIIATKSANKTTIASSAGLDVKAAGELNVKGATVNIN
jgi:uncharacterized protein involved in type VI secretion and phage assembly